MPTAGLRTVQTFPRVVVASHQLERHHEVVYHREFRPGKPVCGTPISLGRWVRMTEWQARKVGSRCGRCSWWQAA